MRLVTSMMTKRELLDIEISKCIDILLSEFKVKYEVFKFNYEDTAYYGTDIDLFDVVFTKDEFSTGILKLIHCYENIMKCIPIDIDFISANDDTCVEVNRYIKDINNVSEFGLFVTNREIPKLIPYYSSEICNAYVNLTHVSFGIYY